ncbi:MAG: flagellar basal body P-ring formation protein FlgA [Sulfuritalea sp.]|jgi:flagella basal body P-ring formation protein FlgA|nr:flagellar basal body P-ring formation protein FlgA [Azonexus sp.]MCC7310400.1 flagellar basal body P-ring formation protein FlgA [Sulfuritalea sp.]
MRMPVTTLVSTCFPLLLLIAGAARAAEVEPIRRAIAEFLQVQNKGLPGKAHSSIGTINAGRLAAGCRSFDVSIDTGARPWGRTHVKVRCTEGATWSLYVPVQIHVAIDYLASARPLRAGQLIAEADIIRRQGDLAELPADILTDPAQALGQSASVSLPANRPLRAAMLNQPLVIRQGQNIKLVAAGKGFQVSREGRALNNAVPGQVVQVRLASGEIIRGTARSDGTVGLAN